jgi:hypothetical protein
MAFWSIGPIRGDFQPESFDEKQETDLGAMDSIGGVEIVQFKQWKAREITVSFLVSSVENVSTYNAPSEDVDDTLPEKVWAKIIELQRPNSGGLPQEIQVVIPGWGAGDYGDVLARTRSNKTGGYESQAFGKGSRPTNAVIKSSSINRTHIGRDGGAYRAIISVTLVESRFLTIGID